MDRTEFIVAMTLILFVTFCVGWAAHWVVTRFMRVSEGGMSELDKMAQDLHKAEEARDQTIEGALTQERELQNQLAQCKAELNAAMEGLQSARSEADNLRAYIEKENSGH